MNKGALMALCHQAHYLGVQVLELVVLPGCPSNVLHLAISCKRLCLCKPRSQRGITVVLAPPAGWLMHNLISQLLFKTCALLGGRMKLWAYRNLKYILPTLNVWPLSDQSITLSKRYSASQKYIVQVCARTAKQSSNWRHFGAYPA